MARVKLITDIQPLVYDAKRCTEITTTGKRLDLENETDM